MSGNPAIWMNRADDKIPSDPKLFYETQGARGILKIPIKQFVLTSDNIINRFTQTEEAPTFRSGCVENDDKVMYEQTMQQQAQQQQQQQQQQQAQQHHVTELYALQKKEDQPKTVEFPFCYGVNMLQKVQQHSGVNAIVGTQISNANEEKGAYRFDVSQPFSYNYALVNQMSLAAAASTATFKCDICGLVFSHLSLLNHHKRIHTTNNTQTTERVFTCDICGSNFATTVDLKAHKQNAHNAVVKTAKCCQCGVEMDCEHADKKKSKYLKCDNCEEEPPERDAGFEGTHEVGTETEENLKTVQPGAHPVKRRGMATVTKCNKCNGSGILFVGGVQPAVEKPFHCNICEGTFSRYSSLWSHKRLHTGDKPFKCEFCGLAFARAAYLKNHSRIHSGERPFKCDVCGMQFSQAPHLKNHERIHSGERPYECEICQKTFARHSTLWNHRRIHTGEKPYRCTVCGSAFNQATHLKNHAKVHTGEKPHRCDICEVGFSDRFALKRHRGIHEKYGQTGPAQSQPPQAQQVSQEQQTVGRLEEMYKCDVTAGIAFPGCSRPQEAK